MKNFTSLRHLFGPKKAIIVTLREFPGNLSVNVSYPLSRVFKDHVKKIIETLKDCQWLGRKEGWHVIWYWKFFSFYELAKQWQILLQWLLTIIVPAFKLFLSNVMDNHPIFRSMKIIKTTLSNGTLCSGVEVILYIICSAAVKITVRSVMWHLMNNISLHFGMDDEKCPSENLQYRIWAMVTPSRPNL